ncbi:MAG: hypothetical protein AAF645_13585, partial [Myxococcota bacterium]
MKKTLAFAMITAFGAVGCGDDDGRGTPDTGGEGGIRFDANVPEGGTPDGGAPPPASIVSCSEETFNCLVACPDDEDGSCTEGCLTADTTPIGPSGVNCGDCVTTQNFVCLADNCPTQVDALDACGAANSCEDATCLETNCGTEIEAFNACAGAVEHGACT